MRRLILIALFALPVILVGCSRIYGPVAELNDFIAVKDSILDEGFKRISASPNVTGVDEAQKIFDSKKADLTVKKDALDKAPSGMNGDWLTKKYASEQHDDETLGLMKRLIASDAVATQRFAGYEKAFKDATTK